MHAKLARLVRRPLISAGLALPVVALIAFGAHAELSSGTPSSDTTTSSTSSTGATSGQSTDSHAIVVNHGDDRYRYALTLKIVHTFADTVAPQNAAIAVAADCNDCQTVAISLEGVLVYGDPSVFEPENLALAYNQNCDNCATLAAAYQEVVQTGGKVRITGAGRQEIARIRQDIEAIRQDNLTLAEIDARVNADAAALLQVLRTDTVPIGQPAAATPAGTTPPSNAAARPTATPSAQPTATTSPSASATSTPTSSASPTATSTP